MKLIYHPLTTDDSYKSIFDKTVVEMCAEQDIKIACPYLSIDYLERILAVSNRWKLITDINALFSLHNETERERFVKFITENKDNIKHHPDLHAKIIFTEKECLIGSANFTKMGIRSRTEMSVLIDDKEKITEVKEWYDLLWDKAQYIDDELLSKAIITAKKTPKIFTELGGKVKYKTVDVNKYIKEPEINIYFKASPNLIKYYNKFTNDEIKELFKKLLLLSKPGYPYINAYFMRNNQNINYNRCNSYFNKYYRLINLQPAKQSILVEFVERKDPKFYNWLKSLFIEINFPIGKRNEHDVAYSLKGPRWVINFEKLETINYLIEKGFFEKLFSYLDNTRDRTVIKIARLKPPYEYC